jgi:transcriptional regulator with XRE-family HTH domain
VGKPIRKKRIAAIPVDLERYMEKHGLSQQHLADKLKVSQGLVWQWLNGVTAISPEKAKDLEDITGIPRIRLLYPEERIA